MIKIQNQQSIPLNLRQIRRELTRILAALEYSDFDVGILLADAATMQAYNREYRGQDQPTDILSFPFYPNLKAGERINTSDSELKNLGDIIICPAYVQTTLSQWHNTMSERLPILLVHGICHLLGYDHITDEDYAVMQQIEQQLLNLLKNG